MSFARAKGLGKWAEKHVIEHLSHNKDYGLIKDVSELEEYQKQGIDIICYPNNDSLCNTFTADIKLDRLIGRTGNLFIETMSSEKVMGNMVTSSADYFLYLDPIGCRLFVVDRLKMFRYWQDNQKDIVIKTVGNKDRKTQGFLITTELILYLGLATVEDIYIEGARNNKVTKPQTTEALPF